MNNPLVSIITPCFNGGKYLREYFDSVLNQTYSNIEFFFVNDGSNDDTENIAAEYESKFQSKGISYKHFYITNSGQAAAINYALKLISGKYFIWPDADDILTPDNLKIKVDYLEKHPEVSIVFSYAKCIDKNSKEIEGKILGRKGESPSENVFLDYLTEKNIIFHPGVFMARFFDFCETNPDRSIYPGRGGQNWQFILPLVYKKQVGFLQDVTYFYRMYEDSHSRSVSSFSQKSRRIDEHEEILFNVLNGINCDSLEKEEYRRIVQKKYLFRRLYLFAEYDYFFSVMKTLLKIIKLNYTKDLKIITLCKLIVYPTRLIEFIQKNKTEMQKN